MENYFIKIPHFYSMEYHEDDKTMIIDLDFRDEILYLHPCLVKKWEPPYENIELSYKNKMRILHNIRKCLLKRWKPEQVIIEEGM